MKLLLTALFLSLLISCNNSTLVKSAESKKTKSAAIKNPVIKYGIEGFYTGAFEASKYDENKDYTYSNKITICIDSLNDKMIFGHSVVAGNDRSFAGGYTKDGAIYTAVLKEPGDNKYDGVFTLSIAPAGKKIQGVWIASDKTLAVTERKYELEKQLYKYDPSLELPEGITDGMIAGTYDEKTEKAEAVTKDVLKVNASKKLLTGKDIENMYKADLEVVRNAIYARHGYSFKNIRMRDLFDNYVPWYMPVSTDVSAYLTEVEKKNIALIKRYEQHATKYYDVFGR